MRRIKLLISTLKEENTQMFIQSFAFSVLLSIAPLITIFVIAFKQLAFDPNFLISLVSAYLPLDEVLEFIEYIQANNTTELVSLILLLATTLYLSSRSVYSFLRFSDDLEGSSYPNWYLRILAIWGQLIFIILVVVLVLIISFTTYLRYPLSVLSLFLGFLVYYRNLSFKHRQVKDHWKGALVTTVLLILMGIFFMTYISNFTNYESLYGPLSSLMVVLLSVYVIAFIIVLGFLINYASYDPTDTTIHLKRFNEFEGFKKKLDSWRHVVTKKK